MLRKKGIRQSMSRKGNCLDNAVMVKIYGALQAGTAGLSGLLQQLPHQGKTKGLAACNSQTTETIPKFVH